VFIGYYVKIYLDNIFLNFGFVLNGFMMLDTVDVSINDDVSIYTVRNSNTTNNSDIITWYARWGYIGQN
jgi:hypothetical protein